MDPERWRIKVEVPPSGICDYPLRGVASNKGVTVPRLYRVGEYRLSSPPSLNVMYCVRVSLWTVKIFLIYTKEKGLWVISVYC